MISIVIPTVDGREEHLERCINSYENNTFSDYELIVVHNQKTCGEAWDLGSNDAKGDFIHFTADDLECHKGWDIAAKVATAINAMPHPRCYRVDGTLDDRYGGANDLIDVPMTTIPFMTMEMWKKIKSSVSGDEVFMKLHYYSDDWISWLAHQNEINIVSRHGYDFIHYIAQVRRGAGMLESERMGFDQTVFEQAKNNYAA